MAELTFAEISKLLKYEPETGRLLWLVRPVEMCPSEREALRWNSRFAGREALATINKEGYLKGAVMSRHLLAHRVAWMMHYMDWPKNTIDHINGVRSDNRISNLRDVTVAENMKNKKTPTINSSGFRGVCWNKASQKWQPYIRELGKNVHLGLFSDFDEAVSVRKLAEERNGYHENHGRTT